MALSKKQIMICTIIGLTLGIVTAHYSDICILCTIIDWSSGSGELATRNEEGRFYCWAIDALSNSPEYLNTTDYEKDLIKLHKKWCIDEPRQNAGLVMPTT